MVRVFGLALIFITVGNLLAGEAYYGFIEEPTHARAVAMGSSGTSALGMGGFAFYNPALPAVNKSSVFLEFGKLYEDLNRGFLEFEYNFSKWFIGVSFQSQSITFQYSDERGVKPGSEGSEQGIMASVAAGVKKERLSMGFAINGIHHRIADDYSNGFTFSVGALYQIIPGKFNSGAAILNFFGRNTRLIDPTSNLHSDKLPLTARAGASWIDTIAGQVPFMVSADIVYSDNYEKLMVPVGVEAWVLPLLAVRLGYRINHPTDLVTMGLGLKLVNLKYDVAFTPVRLVSDIEMKWSMGLTYELPSQKKKKSQEKEAVSSSVIDFTKNEADITDKDSIIAIPDSVEKASEVVRDSSESGIIEIEQQLLLEDSTESSILQTQEKSTVSSPDTFLSGTVSTQDSTDININLDKPKTENAALENVVTQPNAGISSDIQQNKSTKPVDSDTIKTE